MVAKITFPKKVEAALNYNEQKVANGKATCIAASGYLKEPNEMNFHQKLEGLNNAHTLNDRATTKTLHVSLNFDPSEKLSDERLSAIANAYMEKIGFGDQPYLIYRHQDAGHPHIHIVTSTIRGDGSRINTHNIGKNASEKARKELEVHFNLIKAEKQKKEQPYLPKPIAVDAAVYGKVETKKAISSIVTSVFQQYQFASLPEYNAALRQFNVVADRGKEGGRIYRNNGLVYRLLDEDGNKVGVPVKASSISCQPTIASLENKFKVNTPDKEELKQSLKSILDNTAKKAQNIKQLIELLRVQQVHTVLRQNNDGRIYGVTFVDNRSKCVFNGSDLGKDYSAASIQNRLLHNSDHISLPEEPKSHATPSATFQNKSADQHLGKKINTSNNAEKVFEQLLSAKEQFDNVPSSLLNKNRKKKKRRNPNSSS